MIDMSEKIFDSFFAYVAGFYILADLGALSEHAVFWGAVVTVIAGILKVTSLTLTIIQKRQQIKNDRAQNKHRNRSGTRRHRDDSSNHVSEME